MQTKQDKKKVSKFGNLFFKEEDILKVLLPRIKSYTEEDVEDELDN